MGFIENNKTAVSDGTLDLTVFENKMVREMNRVVEDGRKYEIEEFGMAYNEETGPEVYRYDGEEITICPEPLEFLKKFDDVSDDAERAHTRFKNCKEEPEKEKIKINFKRMNLDKRPYSEDSENGKYIMWMNKTSGGINLRPGNLNDDIDSFDPVRMSDDNVHGLIAGRTGSGKSVFINALILSLITEYPPWELNLYLADFKKVELSRYMNDPYEKAKGKSLYTPHVNACAATSEIRYVSSMIKHLVDCMNARQEMFARLGVTKLQEFRQKYNVVLPRVLLIVDEFQQMFMEATGKESEEIQTMLNSITKLGRATGFHLIFASQEMSGTLRGNTLENFKIRMALPCNQGISVDILGNSKAVSLERGYVLINTEAGDERQNKEYRVPFIETDKKDSAKDNEKPPFYGYLDVIKNASEMFDLSYKKASQKFYQEDLQEKEKDYLADLEKIRERKNKQVEGDSSLFDAVVLGKTVLYSTKPNDKVSFCIEKGRNKGIMIACPDVDRAARVRKLLAENLLRSNQETWNFGVEKNRMIEERYPMKKLMEEDRRKEDGKYNGQKYFSCDAEHPVEFFELTYYLRALTMRKIEASDSNLVNFYKAEQKLLKLLADSKQTEEHREYKKKREQLEGQLEEIDKDISETMDQIIRNIDSPILRFLRKCSDGIILIPEDKTRVNFSEIPHYKEIENYLISEPNLKDAVKKCEDLLKPEIEKLRKKRDDEEKKEDISDAQKKNNIFAVRRYNMLLQSIQFYQEKLENGTTMGGSIESVCEKYYEAVLKFTNKFKEATEKNRKLSEKMSDLNESKTRLSEELDELLLDPNPIEEAEKENTKFALGFINSVIDGAYSLIKTEKPEIPQLVYEKVDDSLAWRFEESVADDNLQLIVNDILEVFINAARTGEAKAEFKRTVYWFNGLDEIEQLPYKFTDIVRDAINKNILVIAIITSELNDSLVKRAFDYVFVTGNVEKFYDMFNLRYTKQPLDSIVINFGIVSMGVNIPFKMYRSELETVHVLDFVDALLNE